MEQVTFEHILQFIGGCTMSDKEISSILVILTVDEKEMFIEMLKDLLQNPLPVELAPASKHEAAK